MPVPDVAHSNDQLHAQPGDDEGAAGHSNAEKADLWRLYGFQEVSIGRNIQLCDAKASIIVVAISAVLTALVRDHRLAPAMGLVIENMTHFSRYRAGSIAWSTVLACAAFLVCGAGLGLSLRTVAPRFRQGDGPDTATISGSMVSWISISQFKSPRVYAEHVLQASEEQLLKDALCHLHDLSCVCKDKMKALAPAMRVGILGILLPLAWLFLFGGGS